ncbi:uncharacterized protein LOC109444937 [Rhinolophus sinicus]|uniref:uncharacterized protein LOC109444937 n=1 Tax=Rhinolophus sinicus TaxID=89399 RepID=UPI003D78D364
MWGCLKVETLRPTGDERLMQYHQTRKKSSRTEFLRSTTFESTKKSWSYVVSRVLLTGCGHITGAVGRVQACLRFAFCPWMEAGVQRMIRVWRGVTAPPGVTSGGPERGGCSDFAFPLVASRWC